jgi:regulatory protein
VKISRIEVQKKNKDRCSIFIDGKFKFGLDKNLTVQYGLFEGAEISQEEINKILHQAEKTKIMNRAFKILHYRQRTVKEIRNRLVRIGFNDLIINEVIDELIADRTLDDERFARAFVNDHTNLKLKGNYFITRELTKKGITQETISRLLAGRDEEQLITEYIEKKARTLNVDEQKDRQKLVRRLLNRGFTPDLVYGIIKKKEEEMRS